MSRPKLRSTALALALACCALLVPAGANAATVVNGDFETGTLSGWGVFNSSDRGNWFPYAGTKLPLEAEEEDSPFFAPPQGNWAAVSDESNPDLAILYQDLTLEPFWTHNISLTYYYRSNVPIAIPTPYTLDVPSSPVVMAEPPLAPGQDQQQLRIDVIKPAAAIDTVVPSDILTTLFANKVGDPQLVPPTALSADLSPFAGQTVRLRIANAVNEEVFNTGIDGVSITSTPPSNDFTRGKLQRTPGTGGGFLAINVPGAGLVTAVDARTKIATATTSAKAAVKRISRAVKKPRAAGKVLVPLHPTNAGFKTLENTGELKVKVRVTFTPTGGTPSTKSFKVKLKLTGGGS